MCLHTVLVAFHAPKAILDRRAVLWSGFAPLQANRSATCVLVGSYAPRESAHGRCMTRAYDPPAPTPARGSRAARGSCGPPSDSSSRKTRAIHCSTRERPPSARSMNSFWQLACRAQAANGRHRPTAEAREGQGARKGLARGDDEKRAVEGGGRGGRAV
eukprot:856179-Prymnesium_polylepis.1